MVTATKASFKMSDKQYGTALRAAHFRGHGHLVQVLLESGTGCDISLLLCSTVLNTSLKKQLVYKSHRAQTMEAYSMRCKVSILRFYPARFRIKQLITC